MNVRYLLDECVPARLDQALRSRHTEVDFIRVGGAEGPKKETQDPDLLLWVEAHQRLLVTRDKNTMPGHIVRHRAAGRRTWGVLYIHERQRVRDAAIDLARIAEGLTAEEWIDQELDLPI